jgi:hypothetical protein
VIAVAGKAPRRLRLVWSKVMERDIESRESGGDAGTHWENGAEKRQGSN